LRNAFPCLHMFSIFFEHAASSCRRVVSFAVVVSTSLPAPCAASCAARCPTFSLTARVWMSSILVGLHLHNRLCRTASQSEYLGGRVSGLCNALPLLATLSGEAARRASCCPRRVFPRRRRLPCRAAVRTTPVFIRRRVSERFAMGLGVPVRSCFSSSAFRRCRSL